ncbi:MAG: hypothetical protein Q9O62_06915 [Ardenticatenia bacterium]|nr:hypothetical protein [Ardenticatenia bacterium]
MAFRSTPVTVYISAASDLMAERDALARAIVELPVTLVWQIVQSPLGETPLNRDALQKAALYVLVMGSDIRAPVGLEWHVARRAGRPVVAFLKRGVSRTPAGQVFVQDARVHWQPFATPADLSAQVQRVLAEHLVRQANRYGLTPEEVGRLKAYIGAEDTSSSAQVETDRSAGRSAVVLSQERFLPSEGVVLEAPPEGKREERSGQKTAH